MGAPSPEPLTFAQADRLNLKPFCERLEKYLLVDFDYADGSLVTALNAGFGCGKTTFLEMWKTDLLARRDSSTAAEAFTAPMPVMLNAWESDYCGDPLVAILAGLDNAVKQWTGSDKPAENKVTKLREAIQDASWCAADLANGFAAKLTGMNAKEALKLKDEKKAAKNPPPPNFIALFNQRQESLHKLQESLVEAFAGDSPKVIVFVDELDRCRPDYAVSYLETIKHVFNVKGMIFLLAVDLHHLEVSAKSLFGNDLNFDEYFRKFCHRRFDLPKPVHAPMQKLLEEYIVKYTAITRKRSSIFNPDPKFSIDAAHLALAFEMTPRQLQEAFRIFGHVMSTQDEQYEKTTLTTWIMGTIFLCYLRAAHYEFYQQIRRGRLVHEELWSKWLFRIERLNAKRWIQIYLTGIPAESISSEELNTYLRDRGYISDDQYSDGFLLGFYPLWGALSNPFATLCRKIEDAECLIK